MYQTFHRHQSPKGTYRFVLNRKKMFTAVETWSEVWPLVPQNKQCCLKKKSSTLIEWIRIWNQMYTWNSMPYPKHLKVAPSLSAVVLSLYAFKEKGGVQLKFFLGPRLKVFREINNGLSIDFFFFFFSCGHVGHLNFCCFCKIVAYYFCICKPLKWRHSVTLKNTFNCCILSMRHLIYFLFCRQLTIEQKTVQIFDVPFCINEGTSCQSWKSWLEHFMLLLHTKSSSGLLLESSSRKCSAWINS